METLWYFLIAATLGVYVALDGFDIGVGILHLVVARTPAERAQVLRSIGPVWDGNEVWLIAAGGTLFAIFPKLYATLLSGFYLAVMAVLWLLVFRALAIELRHQLREPVWQEFWDGAFWFSSTGLVLSFGVALGNVVRGVSLGEDDRFFAPLWTDFGLSGEVGIVDWFTVGVATFAALSSALHGALWLAHRTDGPVQARAARVARVTIHVVFVASLIITLLTATVQPQLFENLRAHRAAFFALAAAAYSCLLLAWHATRHARFERAFFASGGYLFAMVLAAFFAVHPYALPARDPRHALDIYEAAAAPVTLARTLWWWIPGVLLAALYMRIGYRRLPAVFRLTDDAEH